ncbi:hypothetical protein [Hymenobacter cheonanensis]|uniref:hypothetical protein n=1 Tax=Hymenobacter sp. CA2-7 TaxID=3063993 RepID=UPI0027132B86|nr:hypothetical protein [Hymenobacter sp. CA2-7]MDO7884235.1 hypothetical protein [Hymenobacter sp. CA2-7]
MQKQQRINPYLKRREDALLQVSRQIARIMGIGGDVQALSIEAIHCALLDKSTALFEHGGDDTKFQQRLVERSNYFGSRTPFHPSFAEALRMQVAHWPLYEVELYMTELLETTPLLNDVVGRDYLLDVLRDAVQPSTRYERAIAWLNKQKFDTHCNVGALPEIEAQPYEFTIPENILSRIDALATSIGLISEGKFILGERKKAVLVGFHQALKENKWIGGTIAERNGFFGRRYSIPVSLDTFRGSKAGIASYKETNKILKRTSNV